MIARSSGSFFSKKYDPQILFNQFGPDLIQLTDLTSANLSHHELMMDLVSSLKSLVDCGTSTSAGLMYSGENDLVERRVEIKAIIASLLMSHNRWRTSFSVMINQYCHDEAMRVRLSCFMQALIGPVIKLSKVIQNNAVCLSIEFPDGRIRDAFLRRTQYVCGKGSLNGLDYQIDRDNANIIFLPAVISENQTLVLSFSSELMMNRVAKILNLIDSCTAIQDQDRFQLVIVDRRIHDTVFGYHIAVICPYFRELYTLQYASHMFNQVMRHNRSGCDDGVLSIDIPNELLVKIASLTASCRVIGEHEQAEIVKSCFSRP